MGRPTDGYRLPNGDPVPGTTTIIGRFKDSSALMPWAYKQGRTHERMSMQGKPAPRFLHEVVDAEARAGTIAHDMIEATILGHEMPVIKAPEDVVARARNAYAQFLRWMSGTRTEIIDTEIPLVSTRYAFGGTFDARGRRPGVDRALLDWKTSNAVYPDYIVQLGAYAILLEECMNWVPQEYDILRFAKETGTFTHRSFAPAVIETGKRAFLLMRELYDLDDVMKVAVQ